MRRIAVINQKGGVGKTTTAVNLGAALAQQGRRVVVVDMDAQANLSLSLNADAPSNAPSTYTVLLGNTSFAQALRPTAIPGLSLVPSNLDLSGAELELASAIGREYLMRDALGRWEEESRREAGRGPADYVIFDCPPSLGLLSINALSAAGEVLITLQTEFLALQGMSKLVDIVQLLRRRLNPALVITGILPCLYDSRLKLAREVLGEIRAYFPGQVFAHPVRSNVKLAEAPSYGKTIFEYAPDSKGAHDYRLAAREVIAQESRDPELAGLPPFRDGPPADTAAAAPAAPKVAAAQTDEPNSGHELPQAGTPTPFVEATDAAAQRGAESAAEEPAASAPGARIRHGRSARARRPIDAQAAPASPSAPAGVRASEAGPSSTPAAANAAAETATPEPELREVVLTPRVRIEAPRGTERRILRAEELPPLPPDAFEILTRYVHDP